jgi:BMFP domain-containing protein YqiC
MNTQRIEELARRLLDTVPPALRAAQHDLETNFRTVLRSGLAKLDLATREEFDAQTRVLERTRQMVEQLEERVRQLEAQSKQG